MTSALAWIALAATLASLAALVRVHLLPTGYRPMRNAVSDFGVGRFSGYYRAQTAAIALAAVLIAVDLARSVDPAPRRVIVLLFVFAGARFLIPWYPTDLDRSRPTRTGGIHIVLAGVAFASIAWAAATLPNRVTWSHHGVLVALGWLVVATSVACGIALTRTLRRVMAPFFGLVERLFYAAMLAWFVAVAVYLV